MRVQPGISHFKDIGRPNTCWKRTLEIERVRELSMCRCVVVLCIVRKDQFVSMASSEACNIVSGQLVKLKLVQIDTIPFRAVGIQGRYATIKGLNIPCKNFCHDHHRRAWNCFMPKKKAEC